ncbi:hypothetical protein GCM10027271_59280 [Saccharopolyspora gloriosae]|uniref:DNA-binding protein YbaB n=1 Tax=Saccharopolyspora gloriosae TaxID=455344 RepID=A0A840NFB3_9PSEU|nr:DNA-binding protein YbaB [Saccharopolyspora gloriosae]
MSDVDRRSIEMLREEYERVSAGLGDMQRRITELSATAVSPRREVSVTVGNQGVIKDLHFPTAAYRKLPKNELAELITKTIEAAREKATEQMAELIAPMMPGGLNAKAVLSGDVSAEALAAAEPQLPPVVAETQRSRAARIEEMRG